MSDMTPYDAFRIVEAYCASQKRAMPFSSQQFYGFARAPQGGTRKEATIEAYEVNTYPHVWFVGSAFDKWFKLFKDGKLARRGSSAARLASLMAEYAEELSPSE